VEIIIVLLIWMWLFPKILKWQIRNLRILHKLCPECGSRGYTVNTRGKLFSNQMSAINFSLNHCRCNNCGYRWKYISYEGQN